MKHYMGFWGILIFSILCFGIPLIGYFYYHQPAYLTISEKICFLTFGVVILMLSIGQCIAYYQHSKDSKLNEKLNKRNTKT